MKVKAKFKGFKEIIKADIEGLLDDEKYIMSIKTMKFILANEGKEFEGEVFKKWVIVNGYLFRSECFESIKESEK